MFSCHEWDIRALWVMKTIGIVGHGKRLFWLLGLNGLQLYSDFIANSYGESWDSSWEKSWVPVHNKWVPVQKNKRSPKLKNLIACTFLYPDLIWRWVPKLYITVYWKKKSHKQDILPKKSSNRLIVLCILWKHAMNNIILSLWGFLCIRDAGCRDNKITGCTRIRGI